MSSPGASNLFKNLLTARAEMVNNFLAESRVVGRRGSHRYFTRPEASEPEAPLAEAREQKPEARNQTPEVRDQPSSPGNEGLRESEGGTRDGRAGPQGGQAYEEDGTDGEAAA